MSSIQRGPGGVSELGQSRFRVLRGRRRSSPAPRRRPIGKGDCACRSCLPHVSRRQLPAASRVPCSFRAAPAMSSAIKRPAAPTTKPMKAPRSRGNIQAPATATMAAITRAVVTEKPREARTSVQTCDWCSERRTCAAYARAARSVSREAALRITGASSLRGGDVRRVYDPDRPHGLRGRRDREPVGDLAGVRQ